MRILQVNDYAYQIGGAENYFLSISAALAAGGHEVLTVSSNRKFNNKKILSNLQICESGHFFNLDSIFNPRSYFDLRSILKKFQPDVIHFHNIFYALSPSVIYAGRKYPSVLTLHDYAGICHADKRLEDGSLCQKSLNNCQRCSRHVSSFASFKKAVGLHAFKKVGKLIAPSKFMQAQFELNGFRNVSYLPHPLTYSASASVSEKVNNKNDFLYIGRLAEQKGVSLLLKAFSQIRSQARLHIAGSGPEEANLKAECAGLGISDRVLFHGWVDADQRKELLKQAVAVVIPSLWPEVAPLVVGEAAISSVAVIAADIGGLSEMILHQKTGLLFKSGDLAQLTESLNSVIKDKDTFLIYGKAASELAAGKTIDLHLEQLLQIYGSSK